MSIDIGDVFVIGGNVGAKLRPFNNRWYKNKIGRHLTIVAKIGGTVFWDVDGEKSNFNPHYGIEYLDSIEEQWFWYFGNDVGLIPLIDPTTATWEV